VLLHILSKPFSDCANDLFVAIICFAELVNPRVHLGSRSDRSVSRFPFSQLPWNQSSLLLLLLLTLWVVYLPSVTYRRYQVHFKLVLLCGPDLVDVETPAGAQIWPLQVIIPSSAVYKVPKIFLVTHHVYFSQTQTERRNQVPPRRLFLLDERQRSRSVLWSKVRVCFFKLLFISIVTLTTCSTFMKKRGWTPKELWHVHEVHRVRGAGPLLQLRHESDIHLK